MDRWHFPSRKGLFFGASHTGVVAALALSLAGCAALPGGGPAPLDTFDLSSPIQREPGQRRSKLQVLVPEPSALKALDGQNIVIKPESNAIEYLKGAQWADRLPRVVQSRLVEAFQRSSRFGGVGKPGEGLAIDYQVIVEIRAFEIRVAGGATAVVELFARVLNDRNGVVRASRVFEARSAVSGSTNADYIAGLDRAFGEASRDMVAWAAGAM